MGKNDYKLLSMKVADVYPLYIKKAERKNRTKGEVDEIIIWLTGHTMKSFKSELENNIDFKTFFDNVPNLNTKFKDIKGTICGIRIEEIEDKTIRKVRCLDKLIDELAKGKPMEKILRL